MFRPENITFTKPEIHKKGWGEERWICNNEHYCGKILVFNKGKKCSAHYHHKSEVFFCIKGIFELRHFDLFTGKEKIDIFKAGDVVNIPRFAPHQMIALEDSEIIEFSTPHDEQGSFRISQGDSQLG